MVRQGVLANPVPEAIFGPHVSSPLPSGSNYSPLFLVDEAQLKNGVRALASLVLDYLAGR